MDQAGKLVIYLIVSIMENKAKRVIAHTRHGITRSEAEVAYGEWKKINDKLDYASEAIWSHEEYVY